MSLYKYIRAAWKKPKATLKEINKKRVYSWRREPSTIRINRPTRLDRARSLGYKAKQGFIIVRQRVKRGGRQREKFKAGRRPKHMRRKKIVNKNYQQIAEERTNRKFVNCEVLNSYNVGKDGEYYWYEVILVDTFHPQILSNEKLHNLAFKRGRTYRGLTSAGRKSRGLRK
ncbi:50S ribosomal protein L15e [Candidatus Woesearchaeota archaeon]|jgi:large subunit ribosomal protein L15e|nr:50S ribosomal protein L15e [Candidatus Woesearchaeota archaeon]